MPKECNLRIRPTTLIFASILLFSAGALVHNAFADIVISDQSSCTSEGGIWDSASNACNVDTSNDPKWIIYPGQTFRCSGIVLNFLWSFSVPGGTFDVSPTCTVNNLSGHIIANNGTIINAGTINNLGDIQNAFIFNNTGTVNNNGTFSNIDSYFRTVLTNTGTINNYDQFANLDYVNNYGAINNMGPVFDNVDVINNEVGGIINNNGTIQLLPYDVNGYSQDDLYFKYIFNNYGTINNNAGAMIENEATLNNECGGIINNDGTISGNQTINIPCQPNAVTGLTATGKITHVDLSWTAPSDKGGIPILGYEIQRSINNGTTWDTIVQNTNSTGTTFTDSHLKPVQTYTYRVSSINSVGISEPSNVVSVRPLIPHQGYH